MPGLISSRERAGMRPLAAVLLLLIVGGGVTPGAQTAQPAPRPKPAPPAPSTTKNPDLQAPKPGQEDTLPSARSIIDRHVKAIGGRAAILAHTSSHATGTFSMPAQNITGALDVYGAKPDKSLLKFNLGGIGDIVEGFDGTNGWALQPMTGPMLKEGKELAERKIDADFYSDLKDQEHFPSMKTLEKTTFDGRPCYKISLIRKGGGEDIEFYDVETGLRAGALLTRESPMGPITATQTLSDYKKFGDLLVPTTMKQSQMGVEQVLKITALEWDNVPPSTFDPPAQIKALIK